MKSSKPKHSKRKYKAIIFDVDGTLILNKRDGVPSQKVTAAISKINKKIYTGIATSRPYSLLSNFIDILNLNCPLIVCGGTQIIHPKTRKIIWERPIDISDANEISTFLKKINILDGFIILNDGEKDHDLNGLMPKKPLQFWAHGLTNDASENIFKQISKIKTVAMHKAPSWKKEKIDLLISHTEAGKKHALLEVSKLLKIKSSEIIGVGDGHNDIPLLSACGLKIAMGNAVPELKAIADYIAPSVEEDGVVDIIEKFVL